MTNTHANAKTTPNAKSTRRAAEPVLGWLTAQQAASFLSVSLRTFRDLAKEPDFPPAKVLGPRSSRWDLAQLQAWMERKSDFRPGAEPPELAQRRAAKAAGREVLPAPFSN